MLTFTTIIGEEMIKNYRHSATALIVIFLLLALAYLVRQRPVYLILGVVVLAALVWRLFQQRYHRP